MVILTKFAALPRHYLYLAVVLLLVTVWNATGYHQGDEHFQILEFAAYKVGLISGTDLPWEFEEQMRPALQPLMAYSLYRIMVLFGPVDPFLMAGLLRLFSAGFFLLLSVLLYQRYGPAFPKESTRRWLAIFLLFTWCNVYAGVRFASEFWSGATFIIGMLLFPTPQVADTRALPLVQSEGGAGHALAAGLFFGLSFELRYQMALAVVGFVAWLILVAKPKWRDVALMVMGGIALLGVGTIIDRWFYGDWVIAPWNYLAQNLIAGKAAEYGTKPWYGYIEYVFERGIPPLSLVYLAAIGYFCWRYRKDPITWSFLVFFVVHSLLSRKDIRFLFPLLPFLPIALVVLLRDLKLRFGDDLFRRGWPKWVFGLFATMSIVLLISVSLRTMNAAQPVMRYVYQNYSGPLTLFADGKHMYNHSALVVRFYQPEGGVKIIHAEDRNWPECTASTCLYSEETRSPNPPPGARLVYTTAPTFLGDFDPFGLVSQQRFWYLYEL